MNIGQHNKNGPLIRPESSPAKIDDLAERENFIGLTITTHPVIPFCNYPTLNNSYLFGYLQLRIWWLTKGDLVLEKCREKQSRLWSSKFTIANSTASLRLFVFEIVNKDCTHDNIWPQYTLICEETAGFSSNRLVKVNE